MIKLPRRLAPHTTLITGFKLPRHCPAALAAQGNEGVKGPTGFYHFPV